MGIWAKSNGVSLKDHVECLLTQAKKLKKSICISEDIFKILECAIILHDIGKVSPSFQMAVGNCEYKPKVPFTDVPHSIFSLVWIDENNLKREFNNSKEDVKILLSSVAFHHWRERFDRIILGKDRNVQRAMEELSENSQLVDELLDNLKKELNNYTNLIHYNRKLADILREGYDIFDYIVPPYKNYSLPKKLELDESTKKKFILVSGLLIRIDHFASYLQQEASNNCDRENIEIEPLSYMETERRIVEKVSGNLWQREKLENNRDKSLILVAPTGSGKSEFAFLWGAGDKLIFTLPLRSAVNAMFERARNIFGEDKVGLLHSDADVYLYESTAYEGERMRGLDLARHLAYPVLITIGDQIFPSALKYPGYEKIYATLSYSKLVVDEVQAYDPRAIATIIKLLEDMEKLGGKFLLMTATLPNFVRKELTERIGNTEEIDIYENYRDVIKHKIQIREGDLSEKAEKVIEEVINKAEEGKCILVIFNTVEKAQSFYKKLKEKLKSSGNNIYLKLLHSRFTLEERKKIEEEIIREFSNPKPKDESKPKILVATQVVEASLDIDADLLYTELAPIDALIQRMGRVIRRYRKGKHIDENSPPNVYVFYKDFYEGSKQIVSGAGRVYLNELLYLSLVLLILKSDANSQQEFEGKLKEFKEKVRNSKKIKDETIKIIRNNTFKDITLSESDKKYLVEKLYDEDILSGYFDKFYATLNILDAGFVSEYKEEALRIFREIYNIPVIPKELLDGLRREISNLHDKSYTSFKSNVLSRFVVYVDWRYLGNKSLEKVSSAIEDLGIKDRKLLRWLDDVYLIDAKYDKDVGLEMKSENTAT